ncbi:glycosyl hydrolase family 32 [Yonghaparkia sp. Soil809]|uniref:glycosyl hydrolase family 32 n=1 Tax=Yonghaparkia sp. Soil809 TaxID=1736417 RepID=UPI0006F25A8E|nr:glycosyl hydrolase family 32 [Yonghaparkia sp. Soil809]KRF32828.1 glycosyl hydrolase family 32 [Yonghaparkia sp. Soil809]
MPFSLRDHWVWDFWFADDGERFHLYYLHAPCSLGDPHLRHRNARLGHAISTDLREWEDLGPCLLPSGGDAVDADATWTGSIVRDPAGGWRMHYTGSRFLRPDSHANIETVAVATSTDLHTWVKHPELSLSADPALYETLGHSVWPEEAWRDPWVMPAPGGATGWWMLVTARSRDGADELDRGVVGLAVSDDLVTWRAAPALSAPGAGFKHLEVPQIIDIDGHDVLLFSCDTPALAGAREARGETGGVWAVEVPREGGPYAPEGARLILDESTYAARAVRDRSGRWQLLGFRNLDESGAFVGGITDPMPLSWSAESGLVVGAVAEVGR